MQVATKLNAREKIAVAVSAAIVLAIAVYWLLQVKDVLAMLKLAHGG